MFFYLRGKGIVAPSLRYGSQWSYLIQNSNGYLFHSTEDNTFSFTLFLPQFVHALLIKASKLPLNVIFFLQQVQSTGRPFIMQEFGYYTYRSLKAVVLLQNKHLHNFHSNFSFTTTGIINIVRQLVWLR